MTATTLSRAPIAGVGNAPMNAIARGGRRWCGGRYEGLMSALALMSTDGTTRAEVDETFNRVMPWPSWNQRAAHNPSVLARNLGEQGKVILGSLVTPM